MITVYLLQRNSWHKIEMKERRSISQGSNGHDLIIYARRLLLWCIVHKKRIEDKWPHINLLSCLVFIYKILKYITILDGPSSGPPSWLWLLKCFQPFVLGFSRVLSSRSWFFIKHIFFKRSQCGNGCQCILILRCVKSGVSTVCLPNRDIFHGINGVFSSAKWLSVDETGFLCVITPLRWLLLMLKQILSPPQFRADYLS